MWFFENYSLGAWVYLALHGSYGIVWFIKDMVFPDKGFRLKVDLICAVMVGSILLLYWHIAFLMVSGKANQNPSPVRIFCCIFMYVIGLVLMICTDLQKYMTLKYKKGLIDEHFLAINRNTNYFGEVLLYCSFAFLVNEYQAFINLAIVWVTVFVSRIHIKEESLKKKDGYQKYSNNSYLLLFKFFDSNLVNLLFYGLIIVGAYCGYQKYDEISHFFISYRQKFSFN